MPVSVESPALVNRLEAAPETARSVVVVTSPKTAPAPSRRTVSTALLLLVLVGSGLRCAAWMGSRNLWIDESMLALNLVSRGPAELLEPLDWNQGAPVGFLLATKATIAVFGTSEMALRLLPLLGSLAGLIGFARLAPRLMPRSAATIAVFLFSVSPMLLSYSAECKQYATDASIAIGLLAVAVGLLHGEAGFRRWAVLAIAGAFAVWFSHPSAFVLGGIGTPLFLAALVKRDRLRTFAAGATIATWLVSFGLCYVLFLRKLGGNQYLLDYWLGHFLPAPTSVGNLVWMLDHYFTPFTYPGGMGGTEIRAGGISAGLFLVGIWGFVKSRWEVAAALVLPALFALAASALHKYPFAGRLLLFLAPLMILGVARGAGMLFEAVWTSQPAAAVVLLGILFSAPVLETIQELRRPMRTEQLEPVLEQLRTQVQPTDQVHIYYGALPAYEFYMREKPLPAAHVDRGVEARSNPTEYRDQLKKYRGESRVWIVFSHPHKHEESVIMAYADALGRRVTTIPGNGATAILFDFQTEP
jgi:hypothetical protein